MARWWPDAVRKHYDDVIMSAVASQITSLTIVCSMVYSGADQRKHESSASLAFVRGIHRGPVNSPYKWPVTRKMFSFDDVIMNNHYLDQRWCVLKISIKINGSYCCPWATVPYGFMWPQLVNAFRPWQNGRHFPDDIFKRIFLNENIWIWNTIWLDFVPMVPIGNKTALVQIMAWRRTGAKPLSEPMMV